LFVIPNGVDTDRYPAPSDRDAVRRSLGVAPDGRLLIVVAKLYAQKGHAVLLEALATARLGPHDAALFVGDGPERPSLERVARDRDLRAVHFLGNRPDVPQLLAASDLFVLPSLWEGLPMALLEGMASGLPVIATDVAGSRQVVVHGQSGILVSPGDAPALAAAITDLMGDELARARLAAAARMRVEQEFSAARQAERHAAAYQVVLARGQRS
jgi:glycosyltransferase involved in cell wall biosynthesis